jgi:hypothetical protein
MSSAALFDYVGRTRRYIKIAMATIAVAITTLAGIPHQVTRTRGTCVGVEGGGGNS